MKAIHELLEERAEEYEAKLKELKSFLGELNRTTEQHGTDRAHLEEDLWETEHNISYYESEIARLREEAGHLNQADSGAPEDGADSILPHTAKQGISTAIIASVSFIIGALVGSRLKSRKNN